MLREITYGRGSNDWVTRIARLQPWYLLIRFPQRLTRPVFAFAGAAIAIAIISTAAVISGQPLLFPSLGPSAFLFFWQPTAPTSCPRNAILAHGSGVLIGWATYWLFSAAVPLDPLTGQVAAATLSLGLISASMVAAKIPHPPAASTTLIIAMGMMAHWTALLAVMVAIVLLTAECYLINRLSGIVSPIWGPLPTQQGDGLVLAALQTETVAPAKDGYAEIADLIVARQDLPSQP